MRLRFISLGVLVVGVACAGGPPPATGDIPDNAIAPSLGINLAEYTRTPEGLMYKDVAIGTGAAVDSRSKVTVAYRGLLANGIQVDSSARLTFKLGAGNVIKGWQIGLMGMREGGARILVIPSHLGYGWKDVGLIPPYATLLFRVQLIAVAP